MASRGTYGVPMVRHPAASVAARALVYAGTPVQPCLVRAPGPWCGARQRAGVTDWVKTAPRSYGGETQATTLLLGGGGSGGRHAGFVRVGWPKMGLYTHRTKCTQVHFSVAVYI
jgi:hypothetical protein